MSLWADGFELDEPYNNELGILAVSDLLRDRLLFMAVCHYRMEPEFFDPAHYFHPVESRISLCSVSNTSFQVRIHLYDLNIIRNMSTLHPSNMIVFNKQKIQKLKIYPNT